MEFQKQYIVSLAERMENQDNRATQYPLFVVQVKRKQYGDKSFCDEVERRESGSGELCDECMRLNEEVENLPEYCPNCDPACFVWFNWEEEFDLTAGVFLTAEACDEHIRLNHYHYVEPRSFAVSAWRNPEMQELMKFIFVLAGKKVPSQYQ